MVLAKNYETTSTFCYSYAEKTLASFFSGHGVHINMRHLFVGAVRFVSYVMRDMQLNECFCLYSVYFSSGSQCSNELFLILS